ncbi:hypothetical protein [Brevundimonas sp. NIBR11]|uniref:hypothetical protein n=1 Tax=Brevundimonas sp. NIBR11 TaxID=3015999 RepID=UPI0022F10CDA|nr:hypothetical protein [Brevundimonas sp. NIBR11]WGM32168.1 hypothetical protein KKHFBJBL_02419 [Brevundimonas sp. NIBR11]
MPYRRAWWALLLLAPVIGLAFWPAYFGALPKASFAFHAHGLTATAWLALVGFQSWSAHRSDRAVHRLAGRAMFVAVPLFAGAAVLVLHSMATKFAEGSDPFYAALGARLGAHDIISTIALVALVCMAVAKRRNIAVHAACMLSTAILVLPPVIARLPIPRFFHSGEIIAIVLALLAAAIDRRGRWPFLAVAGVQVVHVLVFETVAASTPWADAFAAFSAWPVAPFAVAAAVVALAALTLAWKRVPPRAAGR